MTVLLIMDLAFTLEVSCSAWVRSFRLSLYVFLHGVVASAMTMCCILKVIYDGPL